MKLVGTIMRGSPVYGDGKIYVATTQGWHVLKPTAKGAKVTHRLRSAADDEVTGSPIISHGRIYLTTGDACIAWASLTPSRKRNPIPSYPLKRLRLPVNRPPGCKSCRTRYCSCRARRNNSPCGFTTRGGKCWAPARRSYSCKCRARSTTTGCTPRPPAPTTWRRTSRPRWATSVARPASASCRRCLGSSIFPTAKCRSPGSAPAIATSFAMWRATR